MIRIPSSPTATFLLLVVATLCSFAVFDLAHGDRRVAAVMVMSVAALKIGLILRNFMELRAGPVEWRLAFAGWTILCATLIAGGYYLAP